MDSQVLACSRLGRALRRLATEVLDLKAAEPFTAVVVDLGECMAVLTEACVSRHATGGTGTTRTRQKHILLQSIAAAVDSSVMVVHDAGRKAVKVCQRLIKHLPPAQLIWRNVHATVIPYTRNLVLHKLTTAATALLYMQRERLNLAALSCSLSSSSVLQEAHRFRGIFRIHSVKW